MVAPRASGAPQHGFVFSGEGLAEYQSLVHAQTFPAMSYRPYPLGGKEPTGDVRS